MKNFVVACAVLSPLPVGLGGWSKTPMERAIRNCIDSAVQHILKTKV